MAPSTECVLNMCLTMKGTLSSLLRPEVHFVSWAFPAGFAGWRAGGEAADTPEADMPHDACAGLGDPFPSASAGR